MNYCTKCDSYYEKPGTCNCFAPITTTTQPLPTWVPFVIPATTGTVRYRCSICGREDCTSHITVRYSPPDGTSFSWTNLPPLPAGVPFTSGYSHPVT